MVVTSRIVARFQEYLTIDFSFVSIYSMYMPALFCIVKFERGTLLPVTKISWKRTVHLQHANLQYSMQYCTMLALHWSTLEVIKKKLELGQRFMFLEYMLYLETTFRSVTLALWQQSQSDLNVQVYKVSCKLEWHVQQSQNCLLWKKNAHVVRWFFFVIHSPWMSKSKE